MWLWLDNNDTIMYGCITCQNMAEVTILKCGHTVLVMHKWNSGYCSGRLFTTLLPNLRLCGLSYGQFRRLLKTFFRQVYYSVIWTMCSQSSARLFACQQTLANTTITTLLRDLHWLWVPESVKFKLCMLMHRCLTGAAPRYLTELALPVASTARPHLRSMILSCLQLAVQPSVTVRLLLPVHERGTAYHLTFEHLHHHSTLLRSIWNPTSFNCLSLACRACDYVNSLHWLC